MKRGKRGKSKEILEPVPYKRSILAAFERQNRLKICPLCNSTLSLAAYRDHLDNCPIDKDDKECIFLASYTKEEAVKIRAGPEIILNEDNDNVPLADTTHTTIMKDQEVVERHFEPNDVTLNPQGENGEQENREEVDMRKTEEYMIEKLKVQQNLNATEITIKKSPIWENKRRSVRIIEEPVKKTVKLEASTSKDILNGIKVFEKCCTNFAESQSRETIPYFVKFTFRIIKRVLSTRKMDGAYYDDSFWSIDDIQKMHLFVSSLSNSARYLLIKLFLRRNCWYTMEKLKQKYTEIPNIEGGAVMLIRDQFIDDECSLQDLDEALDLADVAILKIVAKQFKIDSNRGRSELIREIKHFSLSQKSIFGESGSVSKSILKCLKKNLGTCVRIKEEVCDLLKAIFTLYCPTSTNSATVIENPRANVYQEMLYLMLQVENKTLTFPAPNPCTNIISSYRNREELFRYVSSKNREVLILNKMSQGASGLENGFEVALDGKDLIDEESEEQRKYYDNLPINERKFTSLWVLVRCCGHGATILEKMKKYGMAVEWQKYLLQTEVLKPYCVDMRGVWWDRMLLNLDSHLKDKTECFKMINVALKDENILEKDYLLIQDRASRIIKDEFIPKIIIGDPEKKLITSRILSKDLGDGRVNRFVLKDSVGENVECSVEEVVRLHYFEDEGFTHGFHDEGAAWHTLFGIIFYNVIFDTSNYSETWLSELQDSPTDLSNTLYSRRKSAFDEKFEWLREAEDEEIVIYIKNIWEQYSYITNRECAWRIFSDGVEGCIGMLRCIEKESLLAIFLRLAENYRNCRSGFPDLTLYNPNKKKISVVEVKGPGDRLSTKQRLWLDYFKKNGISSVVCHVAGENEKKL